MGILPKVVVVGAGFGGLEAARRLADQPVEVTLVDRNNFHTFQPLLYQVATAGLNAADVASVVRGMFQDQANLAFRQGTVVGVDWDARELLLEHRSPAGSSAAADRLAFDHLVVAGGAEVAWFGVDGAAEHAFPLYTLTDAVRLRNQVLERFEAADADPSLIDDGALTVTVVGGGPTGVETAGALAELFAMVLRKDHRRLDVGRARVVLVEAAGDVLGPFSEPSRRHALEALQARNVEVRLGTAVTGVEPTRVTLDEGEVLASHTLVWAAGVQAGRLAGALGLAAGRAGRVVVDPDLSVPGRDRVWAIGDIAAATGGDGELLPQLAPVAIQGGRHVARQITATLQGRPTRPFRYVDRGTMATIGRRAAVAELPFGIRLRGGPAWLAWLGLHLVSLVGHRNRASVLLNWAWSYLTWDRGPRLILRPDEAPAVPADAGAARS